MDRPFVWQLRVYWEDTDAGGVVYHSRYLNFFERARTEWLRSLGVSQVRLVDDEDCVFVVRRMEVDFLQPARMDDELEVSVHLAAAGGTRLQIEQAVTRRADGAVLARAAVTAACLQASNFKPIRIPGWIRARISEQRSETHAE